MPLSVPTASQIAILAIWTFGSPMKSGNYDEEV
jgi:hypothetical protein